MLSSLTSVAHRRSRVALDLHPQVAALTSVPRQMPSQGRGAVFNLWQQHLYRSAGCSLATKPGGVPHTLDQPVARGVAFTLAPQVFLPWRSVFVAKDWVDLLMWSPQLSSFRDEETGPEAVYL